MVNAAFRLRQASGGAGSPVYNLGFGQMDGTGDMMYTLADLNGNPVPVTHTGDVVLYFECMPGGGADDTTITAASGTWERIIFGDGNPPGSPSQAVWIGYNCSAGLSEIEIIGDSAASGFLVAMVSGLSTNSSIVGDAEYTSGTVISPSVNDLVVSINWGYDIPEQTPTWSTSQSNSEIGSTTNGPNDTRIINADYVISDGSPISVQYDSGPGDDRVGIFNLRHA